MEKWRRGRDSNPRFGINRTHDFQSCTFNRSVTSPLRNFKDLAPSPYSLIGQCVQNVSTQCLREIQKHKKLCQGVCIEEEIYQDQRKLTTKRSYGLREEQKHWVTRLDILWLFLTV